MMLSRWRKESRDGELQGDGQLRKAMSKKPKTPQQELSELAKLKKEHARLTLENDLNSSADRDKPST